MNRPALTGQVSRLSLQWGDDEPSLPSGGASIGADTTQARIFEYIRIHPGVHLRQMCRELGLAMGDVQYHVHRLERDGRVTSVRRGLYRFFYRASLFGERQRDFLSFLSLDTPRELLLSIVEKPDSSQEDLARSLVVSQPTVSWHLKRLTELGIVERRQSGRAVTYSVKVSDAAEIAAFIRSYHPSAWEKWSGRLADIFISYDGDEEQTSR